MEQGQRINENEIIDKWDSIFKLKEYPNTRAIALGCEMMAQYLIEIETKNNVEVLIFPVIMSIISKLDLNDQELGLEVFKIHRELVKYLDDNQPIPKEDEAEIANKFVVNYLKNFDEEVERNKSILLKGSFKLIDMLFEIGVDKETTVGLATEIATNFAVYQGNQDKIDELFESKLTPEQLELLREKLI